MADLTSEVAKNHMEAPHQTGYSTKLNAKKNKVQSVAKYDPNQPRGPKGSSVGGRWVKEQGSSNEYWVGTGTPTEPVDGRTFTSEEGYQWHEQGPVAEWAKALPYDDVRALNDYSGFGYHAVNDLRRGTYETPIIDHFVRAATDEEMRRIGWDPEKNDWVPSVKGKDGEYTTGYPVDPRDQITPESIARFGYPMGKSEAKDYDPNDPYHQVEDGRIVVNQFYTPTPGGPKVMFSIRTVGPDLERLAEVQKSADKLDAVIASHGYVLPEAITVERGAYLPGVTFEQLQDMQYPGPNGEPPPIWKERGFTSTMVGEADRRAKSYPALGKWESISNRFGSGSDVLLQHQDEVGTAVRFHIVLPAGTKVASIESVRRLTHEFPRVPNTDEPIPQNDAFWEKHPELWQKTDYTQAPTVNAKGLQDKNSRSESEVLLGSGAQFRVVSTKWGET